jgi:hypothetical protein
MMPPHPPVDAMPVSLFDIGASEPGPCPAAVQNKEQGQKALLSSLIKVGSMRSRRAPTGSNQRSSQFIIPESHS